MNSKNGQSLIREIVIKIEKKYKISPEQEFTTLFGTDIGKCLNWLRDSIDILDSRPVDKDYMTQALSLNKIDESAYIYALTEVINEYFKNQQILKDMCLEKKVSESYVINILKSYSQELLKKMDIL